jgi:thioredoxin 1
MKNVNKAQLDVEIQNSKKLLVVDFWAEWCGPCKALAPTLTALSEENQDKAEFVKLNVDEDPESATQFKIRGIPTLVFIKDGKVLDSLVGNQSKEAIQSKIRSLA